MKIGIDATALTHSHPTGVEVVTRELLQALLAADTANQYILYTPIPLGPDWQRYPQATIKMLPKTPWWVWRRLGPALPQDHLDAFWSPSNLLPSHLPPRSLATVHDLAFMHFPRYYSWRSRWLSWLTVWRAARLATRIIAVSEQTKQDLINKFKVAADRIVAIPNALPHLPIAAVTPVVNGDYILVVGRVEARKNPTAAIKAFALIAADYPKLQLVFAGSPGFQAEHAKQLAQALGLADRIQFLGFISPQTLADLYAYAKILLFPSFYEGFGLPVLEAFHYGVPVVASTTPAVSEVAGDAALLVEPTDTVGISRALVRLLEEPELRAELIAKGVERLKQFTWDVSAGQLRELINNLDE